MATEASNTRYSAGLPPHRALIDRKDIPTILWIYEEFQKIQTAITGLEHQYPPQAEAPERVAIGMVMYADGVNWNPDGVSGEGLYVYKSDKAWHYLG